MGIFSNRNNNSDTNRLEHFETQPWFDDRVYEDNVTNEAALETPISTSTTVPTTQTKTALICCGEGAELGDFVQFGRSLKKELVSQQKFEPKNVRIYRTKNRVQFMNLLYGNSSWSNLVELHIFSHAFGAGLAFGYHDNAISMERGRWDAANPNPTYLEVVNAETGVLLTDHYVETYARKRIIYQNDLANLEFIKIWGCSSGVSNHVYAGSYWKTLMDKNTPKPSVAQATADFFQKDVFGATTGSHIEYKIKGVWVSGNDYPSLYGKRIPKYNEYSVIRLHPDQGDYKLFVP